MRADEMRELSDDDIRARLAELEEERFRLKFRGATESLEDPLRLRTIRKDVARLHTILRERALEAEPRTSRRTRAMRVSRTARGQSSRTR